MNIFFGVITYNTFTRASNLSARLRLRSRTFKAPSQSAVVILQTLEVGNELIHVAASHVTCNYQRFTLS
jgi:hypothetical protein